MEEVNSDFYITLPSNASMNYFPNNTQSSYRTKLVSPLTLSGDWEIGLVEIFFPRNWFNIGSHNNNYIIYTESQKNVQAESVEYQITFVYNPKESMDLFFQKLNKNIKMLLENQMLLDNQNDLDDQNDLDNQNGVSWVIDTQKQMVSLNLEKGFEVYISKEHAAKFLYILHLPDEDIHIKQQKTDMAYRVSTEEWSGKFKIINKNPNIIKHKIPLAAIRENDSKGGVFSIISKNIEWLNLEKYLTLKHNMIKNEVEIKLAKDCVLHVTKKDANTMIHIMKRTNDFTVTNTRKFKIDPLLVPEIGEFIELEIKEYPKTIEHHREEKKIFLNVGMYKTAEELFKEFQYIHLKQLPNLKVFLEVPNGREVIFGDGLASMLGFTEKHFRKGFYISKYPLELDAGITEIFVYCDIVQSHFVGDTYAPLLRVLPVSNEHNNQVTKYFDKVVYFPLRKHYIDTIEIELRTSSGEKIIFTGGKTCVLLSFRQKKSI